MILITSSSEIFLLFFHCQFCFFFVHFTKKKKSVAGLFLCAIFAAGIIPSGFETYKASSSGSVGKLTERKWNPHMKSNTVRRVTLGNI